MSHILNPYRFISNLLNQTELVYLAKLYIKGYSSCKPMES